MSYIVIYEYFDDRGDYGGYWTDCHEEFDTYSHMIDWIAEMEFRDSVSHKWKYVISSDKNILDICWKDIDNKRNEFMKEKEREDLLKDELKRQQAERFEIVIEEREKALLAELLKKCGDRLR